MTSDVGLTVLRTVVVAHRAGSMTRAADELGLSQPAVTAQVRGLEQRLGTVLFTRTGRGLVPTAAADELVARVGPHVDALTAAVASVLDTRGDVDPLGRTVLLGGPPELTAARLLPGLADLLARGLRLRVSTGLSDGLVSELAAGSLDLVVATVRPRRRGVTTAVLADEEFVLVAAPRRAAGIDTGLLATDPRRTLGRVPVVAYGEELPIVRRYWRHVFGQPPPRSRPAVVVADLRAVAAACVAGAGYSALPRYLVADDLAAGRLVALHEPPDPPINTLHLAWRGAVPLHPAAAAVRDALRVHARGW